MGMFKRILGFRVVIAVLLTCTATATFRIFLLGVATTTVTPVTYEASDPAMQRLRKDRSCVATDFTTDGSPQSTITTGKDSQGRVVSGSTQSAHESRLPVAYLITPTHTRVTQKADLLRLCYTLKNVRRVHWIVVEDSHVKTQTVTDLLRNCEGPSVTHLAARNESKTQHKGVTQRNAALTWLRHCVVPGSHRGGVYFADDDNTYDLRVFEAVRWTRLVSVWLVGLHGGALYGGPVCSHGKVTQWVGVWGMSRSFPMDMAGFSVSLDLILKRPQSFFSHHWSKGHLESGFMRTLNVTQDQMTPQPDANCSQVIAWHTRTVSQDKAGKPYLSPVVRMSNDKKNSNSTIALL